MGILDRLTGKRALDMLAGPLNIGASPWATSELTQVVLSDLFPTITELPMSRAEAMKIPAVAKARNLLVSSICRFPLRALTGSTSAVQLVQTQPSFLYRTDNNVTPYERMAWTIDDIIFNGFSVWLTKRGLPQDGRRAILDAEWCPPQFVTFTDGTILIDEQPVNDDEIILFNSPFEGLLNIGGRTLRGARDQEAAWVGRARNPIPLIELHQTDDSMEPEEIAKFVKAWSTARRSPDGAIGYTPPGLEINVHGKGSVDLMVEGRNAVRTDVGSFLNIRASMLDGTAGIDSLTYATTEGQRNAFYEFDLPFWTAPIEARLSMDDIVPRGQYVRFDKYEEYALTPTPTGAPAED